MPAETNPQQALEFFGFNGTMTDIAFYNTALTDNNIAQLAGGTLPGTIDTITINALLGGNGEIQLGSGKTLSVGRSGTSTTGTGNTFSGTLSGAGNLLKEGTGN